MFRFNVTNEGKEKGDAFVKKMREKIETSVRLKRSLVEYYRQREKKFRSILSAKYYKSGKVKGKREESNAIDWFIHSYRFQNGDSMIDLFIGENRDRLTSEEIAILESWKESLEGIFEVKSVGEDTVRLYNLLDEGEYIVTSNMGREALKWLKPGEFIITRLLPLDDIYLLSGVSLRCPADARALLEEEARRIIRSHPAAALGKNQQKWKKAWERQKELRKKFIAYFGDEIAVVSGKELQKTLEEFMEWSNEEALSTLPPSEREKYKNMKLKITVSDELTEVHTVGIIFEKTEGFNLYSNFKPFMDVFQNPGLIKKDEYKETVLGYLWSESISPLPFKKMVERYPKGAQKVFAALFNKPNWSNERDFPALMKKHKGRFLKRGIKPTVFQTVETALEERFKK